jgi:hypothetical protein
LCVPCALAAGGVRTAARTKSGLSKREIKQRAKERRREEKALAKLQRDPVPFPEISNPFSPGWAVQDDTNTEQPLPPPMTGWDNDLLAPAATAPAALEPDAPATPVIPDPLPSPALGDQVVTLASVGSMGRGLFDDDSTAGEADAGWGSFPGRRRDDEPAAAAPEPDAPHVSFLDEVFASRNRPAG